MVQATEKSTANVTRLVTPQRKASPKREKPQRRRLRQQMLTGAGIGGVVLTLTGLSLSHLASGIRVVTQAPQWECWALAVSIDLGFIALAVASLTTASEKVKKSVEWWARPSEAGALVMSAAF